MGDSNSIPGSGRSSGEGNGNPLQFSYLKTSMDTGAWQATVHGVTRIRHDLSDYITKPPINILTEIIKDNILMKQVQDDLIKEQSMNKKIFLKIKHRRDQN